MTWYTLHTVCMAMTDNTWGVEHYIQSILLLLLLLLLLFLLLFLFFLQALDQAHIDPTGKMVVGISCSGDLLLYDIANLLRQHTAVCTCLPLPFSLPLSLSSSLPLFCSPYSHSFILPSLVSHQSAM